VLEEAIRLDPQNPDNLKQVGHSLYLLGQHKVALEVFEEALTLHSTDWEIYHEKGLCYLYLSQLSQCALLLAVLVQACRPDACFEICMCCSGQRKCSEKQSA
jgi:Bardet-Biedl syndrome 4 protein